MDNGGQKPERYWIPDNISGFWGLVTDKIHDIAVRNWIEAAVSAFLLYMVLSPIPFVPKVRLYVTVPSLFLIFVVNLIGFKDESLSQALMGAAAFVRGRAVLHLSPPTRALEERLGAFGTAPRESGRRERKAVSDVKTDPRLVRRLASPSQRWLPVTDISHGIMTVDLGGRERYVKFLEIVPINLHMMSAARQAEAIEAYLDSFIRKSPESFQLFISTREVDTSALISNLLLSSMDDSKEVREMVRERVEELNMIQSRAAVSRQYVLVYEYEGEVDGTMETDMDMVRATMQRTETMLMSYLGDCGLKVLRHRDEDGFMMQVLYRFLNAGLEKREPFDGRVRRVYGDARALQGTSAPAVSFADFLAPKSLDLTAAGHIVQDGLYRMCLYVEARSYPSEVEGGWLDAVTRFGPNVNVSVLIKKESRDRILDRAPMAATNLEATANRERRKGSTEHYEEAFGRYKNFTAIIARMQKNLEDLYDVSIILTLTAASLKDLQRLRVYVQKELRAFPLRVNDCLFRHETAYLMAMPLNYRDPAIFNKSRRNFLSSSLASMFPYTSYEVRDDTGVLFGLNNNTIVAPDISDTGRLPNMNGIITGSPGAGKTFTELLLASHLREAGFSVFFVLPMKGYEYQRGIARMGGTYVQLWPGSDVCLNLFEVPVYEDPDAEVLTGAGIEYERQSFFASHKTTIRTFISLLARNALTPGEENILDTHLNAVYRKAGVIVDGVDTNDSVLAFARSGAPWPTWDDFAAEIRTDPAMRSIREICSPFMSPDGSCRNFCGQTNVRLDDRCLAFDVDGAYVPGSLHPALLHLATSLVYSIMRRDRREKKCLFLDEVWNMTKNAAASDLVETIYRLVRGYGGGVISATQDINSFLTVRSSSGNLSTTILNCSSFKIAMKADPNEIEQISSYLKMNAKEQAALARFERGNGLLIIGQDRFPVYFIATAREIETFTTDPNLLRRIRERELHEAKGGGE